MSDSTAQNVRCDRPGCLSRATNPYDVGLGGFPAFYCRDHAPTSERLIQPASTTTQGEAVRQFGWAVQNTGSKP